MRALPFGKLAEYQECKPVVSSQSLIRVRKHVYSVPARLIGHTLRVECYESQLKVYLGREHLFDLARLRGDRGGLVDFRHVIRQLLRKPGAFAHYRHRQALYPSTTFRTAHDRLEGVSQSYCHISVYFISSSQLKYHRAPMRRRLAIHSLVIGTTLRPA